MVYRLVSLPNNYRPMAVHVAKHVMYHPQPYVWALVKCHTSGRWLSTNRNHEAHTTSQTLQCVPRTCTSRPRPKACLTSGPVRSLRRLSIIQLAGTPKRILGPIPLRRERDPRFARQPSCNEGLSPADSPHINVACVRHTWHTTLSTPSQLRLWLFTFLFAQHVLPKVLLLIASSITTRLA
jgi:hypothetical protein